MPDQVTTLLAEHFGYDHFKSGQREVVEHLLAGRSSAAVFPTGGGKSLCYQLPAQALPGITLVVSPLIALMKDQIDALAARGIAAQRLDSTLDAEGYRDAMERARSGELRLLYVAPERFNNERFRQVLAQLRVSLFAVDEAHCISEWGHNFRPDYLKLAGFAKAANAECLLALTATATPEVLEDICRVFEIDRDCAVRTPFYRPNLRLLLTPTTPQQRDRQLIERLRERPAGPAIVYVTLQRTAEDVAQRLTDAGQPAHAYHAGMDAQRRSAVQERFLQSDTDIVVATIAFGMGIDKSNIRYVYHYNLPKSLENYAQEIGRSGRDGADAVCEVFACADDLNTLENFVYGDTPTAAAVGSFVRDVFAQDDAFDVSLSALSRQHDLRDLVARTLLTYLELQGHLEGGTPFYSSYRFQPKKSSQQILAEFSGQRRAFLAQILRHARKARTWFDLDVDQAAADMHEPRERIIAALDYLGEQNMLDVQAAGVRHRYRICKRPDDLAALTAELHERTLRREDNELARLGQVVALIEANACQVAALSAHFGEHREPCGHCSWCLNGREPGTLPPRSDATFDESLWANASDLRKEHPQLLDNPRAMARFLCGVPSPSLSKAKLSKHALFGCLDHLPFGQVMARCDDERPTLRQEKAPG